MTKDILINISGLQMDVDPNDPDRDDDDRCLLPEKWKTLYFI